MKSAASAAAGDPSSRIASGNSQAAADDLRIFEKCRRYTRAREAQAAGLYPYFKPISDSEDTIVTIEGKKRLMLGSNNYLGLTHHPKVLEAATDALHRFGSGCTGSRFLNGTLDLHHELEAEISAFVGKEDSLVYSTGYGANLGLVSGLMSRNDVVYLDKLDHASIVDGAQLCNGETVRFRHRDLDDLERQIAKHDPKRGALVLVDGLFSMEGTLSDIPRLVEISQRHGAALAVDDAHAIGVMGPRGDGTSAHYGVEGQVDIITGTFSKSLASVGGFISGSESVIHYLKHNSRPLIFTASLPPASTAGVLAALRILQDEPERREQLWKNTHQLRDGFLSLGFDTGESETPIIPVTIGPLDTTLVFWRRIFDEGVFTNVVVPPAVPGEACCLRTSLMATLTAEQIDRCLEVFARVGRELGVI